MPCFDGVALAYGVEVLDPPGVCAWPAPLAGCCVVVSISPASIAVHVVAAAPWFSAMCVVLFAAHVSPLVVAFMLRPVSGSGCGPIPAYLCVAFRAIVPYRALAFVNRVLPPSYSVVTSQV